MDTINAARAVRRFAPAGLAILTIAAGAESAQAQTPAQPSASPDNATVEAVVVTARRREERLQEVPMAITAFSEEGLRERSIAHPNDLTDAVPGLQVVGLAGLRNNAGYTIRGQGFSLGGDAGALPYFADVPVQDFDPQFFDVENIQVLKGPQGTLFGKNTTGGAVLTVPVKPTNQFGGYAQVELGDYGDRQFEGALNLPIVADKVLLRIAGQYWKRDGFTRNLHTGHELDGVNRNAVRLTLTVRPTESVENTTIYAKLHRNEASSTVLSAVTAVLPAHVTVAGAQCPCANPTYPLFAPLLAAQRARGPRAVDIDAEPKSYFSGQFLINTTTWAIDDNLTLKNIFGYVAKDQFIVSEADASSFTYSQTFPFPNGQRTRTRQTTDELQLQGKSFDDRLSWVAGGYLERSYYPELAPFYYAAAAISFATALPASLAPLPPALSPFFAGLQATVWQKLVSSSKAAYVSGTYAFDNGLSLTAGVRRTNDRKSTAAATVLAFGTHAIAYTGVGSTYVQVPATIALNTTPPAPGALAYNSLESSATTWTLSADYKINDRWMVYATARRGYKAGGFNPSAPAGLTQFAPEKVLDYEIGTKTQWVLGGVRATVNLALFRDDYSNIQRTSTVLLPNGTTGGLTTNVASAVIQGAELEATVDLTDWLSVSGFYEYTDAYYKRWPYQAAHIFPAPGAPPAPGVTVFDFSDNPLAGTPKTKWSLTPRIHLPLGDDLGELSVAVPITHVSRSASNDTSAQSGPSSFIDAHTVADVRVDLRNVRGTNLSLAATVRNVTDETYVQGVLDLTGGGGMIGKFYGPPRMWTIEARYAF